MYRPFQSSVTTIPTVILTMVLITVVLAGTLITTTAAYSSSTSNLNNTTAVTIPTAESVYQSESTNLPSSVGSFIILIANEAHESWQDERHKLITEKNSYYIPKNLVVPQGTTLSFLNADAPWDTPHPQTIEINDENGDTIYTTGVLEYTNSSEPVVLPEGNYTTVNTEYEATEGTISVTNEESNGNLVVGGFYTPSHQVENNMDNDGGVHPGSLQYYRTEFPKNGFRILSEYNFTYAACDYCPGEYWPDNKTGNHTLIIFATEQPLPDALAKLRKLVRDNVYV
ncbi:MAG TPA: hypothetical protein VJ250_00470 [Nitrososphaeraceae archaeon]|nr:hypothetical protein [Nitrososphaeraceae archaeon]